MDHSPSSLGNSTTWESETLLRYLAVASAGPEASDADETLRRAIEIRDGVSVARILSFQHRSAEPPHPVAD